MSRRSFLDAAVLGAATLAVPRVSWGRTPEEPNIVILVADDLGWNDVGYHGSDIKTPRIDAFVRQGIELDRFYVCPICSPTRAALMTGRYPHRFGLRRTVIPPWRDFGLSLEEECLPQLLGRAGYEGRACIGKWHLGHSRRVYHPTSRGFTHFYGHYNGAIDYFTHERLGEMDWHRDFESNYEKGYSTTLLADEAVRFVRDSQPEKPFLLYVPFNAPHSPLQATKELLKSQGYNPAKGPYGGKAGTPRTRGHGNNPRQTYAAMVEGLDQAIGRVLDALEEKGIAKNTLVLFFSDNGGSTKHAASNKPLRGGKNTVWEGGVRVPAAIRWPAKLAGGAKYDGVMGHIDILPSLLAAAGARVTPRNMLDGVNMLPFLAEGRNVPKRTFYLGEGAVVTQDWKLVQDQLFNITRDPSETRDVAAEQPQMVAVLTKSLKCFEALQSKVSIPGYHQGQKGFVPPGEWRMER